MNQDTLKCGIYADLEIYKEKKNAELHEKIRGERIQRG